MAPPRPARKISVMSVEPPARGAPGGIEAERAHRPGSRRPGGVEATGASLGIVPSSPDRPRGWGPPERGAVGRLDVWGLSGLGGGWCDLPAVVLLYGGRNGALRSAIDEGACRFSSAPPKPRKRARRYHSPAMLLVATRHASRYFGEFLRRSPPPLRPTKQARDLNAVEKPACS